MDRYKKLFSNSIVFSVGNLGSKMITFLMVPLYTRFLTTSQYGNSDVISTIVSLLTPILTLSIIEAVFRFALDDESDNGQVLTNGFFISLASFIVFLFVLPFIRNINYGIYIVLLTYASALESTLQQFARGIGKSTLYAATGIVMTVATVLSNLLLIVVMGWQLQGYLASIVVAQFAGMIFLVWRLKAWQYISIKNINLDLAKKMLVYSIPLIPNMVSWWLSNSANKIFISALLGATANGIYAVANKIPSLISVFYSIFTQAWQISAVEEFDSEDVGGFFSTVLAATFSVLFIGVAGLTLFSKMLVLLLSTSAYFEAWRVVPWLALAVLFSSISSFLGTIYTSSMKTAALFTTTIVGAIVNVVSNLSLIPLLGITGAGIGACISFLIVALLRIRDSKRFIQLKIQWRIVLTSLLCICLEIGILYTLPGIVGYSLASICALGVFGINSRILFKELKHFFN